MKHAKSAAAMADYLETWPEIKARHKREKIELLQSLCNNYTVSVAACILNTKEQTLRSYACNNSINFMRKVYNDRTNNTAAYEDFNCS